MFDTAFSGKDAYAADYFRSRYCNSGTDSISSDASIGLPVDGIPVNFGVSNSGSSSHNICDDKTSSHEDWQRFLVWSKTASPVLANAFVDCIRAEGTQLWTERSQVTNAFSIHVRVAYHMENYPPVKLNFSFTPPSAVGECRPRTKKQLEYGVSVNNWGTFKVDCDMNNHTEGVEVGLIASTSIPYGNMSVRPYHPQPVFAMSTNTSATSGVKVPTQADATYGWGADTLLNQYDGKDVVAPTDGIRWAAWNVDGLTPGLYHVYVTYAALTSRSLQFLVDGVVMLTNVAGSTTGGWEASQRQQVKAGEIRINKQSAELRLETNSSWPHFKEMRLVFISD
jgi:hypothetical protein